MKNIFKIAFASALSFFTFGSLALAAIMPPTLTMPTTVEQCKKNGWRAYGDTFKNQGDCVSYVVTEGRNEPDGPPIH